MQGCLAPARTKWSLVAVSPPHLSRQLWAYGDASIPRTSPSILALGQRSPAHIGSHRGRTGQTLSSQHGRKEWLWQAKTEG